MEQNADIIKPFSLLPLWMQVPQVVLGGGGAEYAAAEYANIPCQCPLKLQWERDGDEWWTLPIEPVVTVRGRNVIVKRSVLKPDGGDARRRGTVKELWSQGDYEVNISGVLHGSGGAMPEEAIRKLRSYCESRESVNVSSPLLTLFGISRVVVEEYEFPHTQGVENQMYALKCLSDDFDRDKLLIAEE